jgi:hypothetical protein
MRRQSAQAGAQRIQLGNTHGQPIIDTRGTRIMRQVALIWIASAGDCRERSEAGAPFP